ncbi:MAG: hypothetical protein VKJ64_04790 [Leptolyngbyaceae bacterium]|nr:hypothetical protein [Leptolyngbyaceae bacterium]
MTHSQEKAQAIQSAWWRRPLETLFPDKTFDGQLQNPGTEQLFDFDDLVMKQAAPLEFIRQNVAYYPPDDDQNWFTIFVSGLGQTEAIASKRSRRYAERLLTGIANLNNGSYLKKKPILSPINPLLDWVNAVLDYLSLSGSPVIENCAQLIVHSIEHQQVVNFASDSHGTILLGRALKLAKKRFIQHQSSFPDFKSRRYGEKRWEELAYQFIHVFAFGNGYRTWVKGPKYIMVFIAGDPLAITFGMTPAYLQSLKYNDSQFIVAAGDPLTATVGLQPEYMQYPKRPDIQFLIFESVFEPGNFEAHNMMYTIELLRQSFIKNNLKVGDFIGLYQALHQGSLQLVTAAEAMAEDFPWPQDMPEYTWNATGAFAKALSQLSD